MATGGLERKRKNSNTSLDAFESDDDDDLQGKGGQSSSCADASDVDARHPGMSPVTRQNHSEIEKRRRDKMNTYITELSALIPMCSAMNRKLDKLTVLRMAVQHISSVKGSSKVCSTVSEKPSYISEDDLKRLTLKVADGFLFVVGCDRGRILYVSESVKDTLQYSQSDLIGQSLFDILHPRDISKVKEQLSSSDLTPRERLIDAKTMLPVKTDYPQKPTHLCSGARRSFFCHMKSAGKISADLMASMRVKKELMETPYQRKRKSERKNFKVIHCTGYLKSWSKAKIGLDEDSEADNDCSILNCLVAIGREQPTCNPYMNEESSNIKVRAMEYTSRHNVDGKFTYVDERATVILGYLPQELLGTSVYEYYHQDDIPSLGQVHRKVLTAKDKIETDVYRFKLKSGKFLHLKSRCFGFRNPWTKEVEYIVSTNTVVHEETELRLLPGLFLRSRVRPSSDGYLSLDGYSEGKAGQCAGHRILLYDMDTVIGDPASLALRIKMQEVTSSGQIFDPTVTLLEESNEFQTLEMIGSFRQPIPCTGATQEESELKKAFVLAYGIKTYPSSSSKTNVPNIPGILGGTLPGAGRIGKQIADECMEQLSKTPITPADSSNTGSQHGTPPTAGGNGNFKVPHSNFTSSTMLHNPSTMHYGGTLNDLNPTNNNNNTSGSQVPSAKLAPPSCSSHWLDVSHVEHSGNGINLHHHSHSDDSSTEGSLIQSVMQEQTMDNIQNPGNDANDEAALAFLMSLLEADAGLGGPVDFNDLPWPL